MPSPEERQAKALEQMVKIGWSINETLTAFAKHFATWADEEIDLDQLEENIAKLKEMRDVQKEIAFGGEERRYMLGFKIGDPIRVKNPDSEFYDHLGQVKYIADKLNPLIVVLLNRHVSSWTSFIPSELEIFHGHMGGEEGRYKLGLKTDTTIEERR